MAALTANTPAATYGDLLHMSHGGAGIDATLRRVNDGLGNTATLWISSAGVAFGAGSMSIGTSGAGVVVVGNGTAPSSYPADEAQAWAADISAGNAALWFAGEGAIATVHYGLSVRGKSGGDIRVTIDSNAITTWEAQDSNPQFIFKGTSTNNGLMIGGMLLLRGGTDTTYKVGYYNSANWRLASDVQMIWSGTTEATDAADAGLKRQAAAVILATNGSTGVGAILSSRLVEASTALAAGPNVLLATESRTVLTNEGILAENYHTLPSAAAGLEFTFVVQDTDGIRITAAAGDTIRPIAGTAASGAAGFIRCATAGAFIRLLAVNATEWIAIGSAGTWTIDV